MEWLGHLFGFFALILFIVSYQLKDKLPLLMVQTIATALMCAQFLLLGAYSGFILNIICIIRNILYYYRDKAGRRGWTLPLMLAGLMAGVSLFSWDGLHAVLILSGLMINTVCMGVCDTQNLRKSVVLTCSLNTCYNIIENAPFGALNEGLSVVSAVIGILRMRPKARKS